MRLFVLVAISLCLAIVLTLLLTNRGGREGREGREVEMNSGYVDFIIRDVMEGGDRYFLSGFTRDEKGRAITSRHNMIEVPYEDG
jgi:hypothetical protein